ncbi:MAG: hypothetical protein IPO60_14330 [Flavobacteriales bacterium]|nr:hypothetical protein [Flavobacteriales bacterium]
MISATKACAASWWKRLKRKGIADARVLAAIGKVPRHQFIDDGALNIPPVTRPGVSISRGQTISQPDRGVGEPAIYREGRGKVLEIGTGCGYQTAILCELGYQGVQY